MPCFCKVLQKTSEFLWRLLIDNNPWYQQLFCKRDIFFSKRGLSFRKRALYTWYVCVFILHIHRWTCRQCRTICICSYVSACMYVYIQGVYVFTRRSARCQCTYVHAHTHVGVSKCHQPAEEVCSLYTNICHTHSLSHTHRYKYTQ